ncbi:MAG: OmpH family outer membrane protein [Bacteroidales bacterium]|jgi:outer membrane protein|nr:OmpH family outer membrane protein [Bacteroidales bacterium]
MKKITIAAIILGFISLFGCKSDAPKTNSEIKAVPTGEGLRIATVNTDSLSANFDMVAEITKEIEATGKKLEGDLRRQMTAFQSDYENYLKIGATMTLSEQKKKEAQLESRQQELAALQQRYSEQAAQHQIQKMQEVQEYIFAFIASYNKEHGKYNVILPRSMSSGILYADPEMDITGEVIEAINAEYAKTRKKSK